MFVPHSLFFWSMSSYVVRWSVFRNVFLDRLSTAFCWLHSIVEKFVKSLTIADWSEFSRFAPLLFLYITVFAAFFHKLRVMEFCLMIRSKSSCIRVIVFSRAPLTSSALIPLLSADFPFLRLPNAPVSSFLVNSGMCLSCSSFSMSSSRWSQVFSGPASLPCLSLVSSF